MWPPISTPNHGKISYSKDEKDYEEKDETTNYKTKKRSSNLPQNPLQSLVMYLFKTRCMLMVSSMADAC